MITFTAKEPAMADEIKIGNLLYGAPFIYNGARYIKVNKTKLGDHLTLNFPPGHSVACNLKLGTLRALKGDVIVQVLDIVATTSPGIASEHKKGSY